VIVTVHQPQYIPWPGYWDKIARSDVFVVLDTVQFKKNEWQNRNRIKGPGQWQWLTVPVQHRFGQRMDEVTIDGTRGWGRKHRNALQFCYGRTPYFPEYEEALLEPLLHRWEKLIDLNLRFVELMQKILGIGTPLLRSSQFGRLPGEPTRRIVAIVKELGADAYLSGSGARDYLDVKQFALSGIEVLFQDYRPPVYAQRFGEFIPGLSGIDVIFNCGAKSMDVIMSGNRAGPIRLELSGVKGGGR
jgi:hypothetical protein